MPRVKSKPLDPPQPSKITEVRYRADTSKRQVTLHEARQFCENLARKPDGTLNLEDVERLYPTATKFLIKLNDYIYSSQQHHAENGNTHS